MILFGPKRGAKTDWKVLHNRKFDFSFPLDITKINKSRRIR
jgi:hypothetical protein